MAVCRVEKSKDYTVMSNYHLKDKTITLKAKGLLSQMLSLPESWNYTLEGLAQINKEKIDAIRTAIRELEAAGYIHRTRERDEKGRLGDTVYVIYEHPQPQVKEEPELAELEQEEAMDPTLENPMLDNPMLENPMLENPMLEKPTLENPMQLNTYISNTNKSNTNSFIPSFHPSAKTEKNKLSLVDQKRKEAMTASQIDTYRNLVKQNISYDLLMTDARYSDLLPEIVELITDTVSGSRKTIRISGADYPFEPVKSRLLHLNENHIVFVIDAMHRNTTKIRNIKAYLLTALYNAPVTIDSGYAAMVNHDMASGERR